MDIDIDKYDTPEKQDQCRALIQEHRNKKGEPSPGGKWIFLSSFLAKETGSARIMRDSGIAEEDLVFIDRSDKGQIPFCLENFPKAHGIASSWDDAITSYPKDQNGNLKGAEVIWLDHVLMPEKKELLKSTHETMNVCGKDVLFMVNTVLRARQWNYNGTEGAPGIIKGGRDQFFRSLREKMGPDGDRWFAIEPKWKVYRQHTAVQDMGIYLFWSAE